jgi:glycosyltransferase involved in cell wall biosynthesis
MSRDVSVLIPARNEIWLKNTVEDVLTNKRANTNVIVVLDGQWADPGLVQHEDLTVIKTPASIGQRAATNLAARISDAKYVMKLDAHCAVAEGFDQVLMADCQPDWTVVPRMYNLHVFDWRCTTCGKGTYQGPQPKICECGGQEHVKDLVWKPRWNRETDFARFDNNLHFQYWGAYKARPESQADIADVMCCVGAGWFMERNRYWQLGGLDEAHGSWGQMGVELACKSWLSGGRQVVNKKTWFSHLFRTRDDFSFPYPMKGSDQEYARVYSRDLWQNNKWPGQVHKFEWLLRKFSPVPGFEQFTPTKSCVYYTDSKDLGQIGVASRKSIEKSGLPIVSVSLQPLTWGQNIVLPLERGSLTMFKQILAGLEAATSEYVFLTEHDVVYHPSHFDFVPPRDDTFYYNDNVWKVDATSGRALHYDCNQTSGLVASRQLLLDHYRERIARVESEGFKRSMGFEPGTRHTRSGGIDDLPFAVWQSAFPNIDIRHHSNLTASRWSKEEFRNQRYTKGWLESNDIPGWGSPVGRFSEWLAHIS